MVCFVKRTFAKSQGQNGEGFQGYGTGVSMADDECQRLWSFSEECLFPLTVDLSVSMRAIQRWN